MEGFQEFEARRRKKFDKQIDSNVMISSKGLDEGVDLWFMIISAVIVPLYKDSNSPFSLHSCWVEFQLLVNFHIECYPIVLFVYLKLFSNITLYM